MQVKVDPVNDSLAACNRRHSLKGSDLTSCCEGQIWLAGKTSDPKVCTRTPRCEPRASFPGSVRTCCRRHTAPAKAPLQQILDCDDLLRALCIRYITDHSRTHSLTADCKTHAKPRWGLWRMVLHRHKYRSKHTYDGVTHENMVPLDVQDKTYGFASRSWTVQLHGELLCDPCWVMQRWRRCSSCCKHAEHFVKGVIGVSTHDWTVRNTQHQQLGLSSWLWTWSVR